MACGHQTVCINSARQGPGIVHSGGLTQPSRSCPQAGGRHANKCGCTRKLQREERRGGIKKQNVLVKAPLAKDPCCGIHSCYYSFESETPLLTFARADTTGDSGVQNVPVCWERGSPGRIKASEVQKLLRLVVITTRARVNKTRGDGVVRSPQHIQGLSAEAAICLFGLAIWLITSLSRCVCCTCAHVCFRLETMACVSSVAEHRSVQCGSSKLSPTSRKIAPALRPQAHPLSFPPS